MIFPVNVRADLKACSVPEGEKFACFLSSSEHIVNTCHWYFLTMQKMRMGEEEEVFGMSRNRKRLMETEKSRDSSEGNLRTGKITSKKLVPNSKKIFCRAAVISCQVNGRDEFTRCLPSTTCSSPRPCPAFLSASTSTTISTVPLSPNSPSTPFLQLQSTTSSTYDTVHPVTLPTGPRMSRHLNPPEALESKGQGKVTCQKN
ncbi:unnamed protein product [Darwinula stevensoni]|uniref:Uncharacterized protein n=1 Tax=Darwinula stevensoni TaxID=69355 RepID=A0A7R9A0M4_9CRUS|nr:unnamed protein product [Darwinula stevensoni]CAG0885859.1 unnamed protein product [Darwinula stevensoni]